MKTYHLPCGIKNGAVNEYYGNFDSYCPNHKHKRTRGKDYVLTDLGLVPEQIDEEAGDPTEASRSKRETSRESSKHKKERIEPRSRLKEKKDAPLKKTEYVRKIKKPRLDRREKRKDAKKTTDSREYNSIVNGDIILKKRPIIRPKLFDDFNTGESSEEEDGATQRSSRPSSGEDGATRRKNRPSSVENVAPRQGSLPSSEEDGATRRSNRPRRKVEHGSTIYKSAKEELEKILKSKYVSIEATFEDLSGKRWKRGNRNSVEDSDSSDDNGSQRKRTICRRKKVTKPRNFIDINTSDVAENSVKEENIKDEESIASIEQFLGETGRVEQSPRSTLNEEDPLQDCNPSQHSSSAEQDYMKTELKSPRVHPVVRDDIFIQNDGSADSVVLPDDGKVEEVFPDRDFSDISEDENQDIGIEEIIDNLSVDDERIQKHKCSNCSFTSDSRQTVKDHIRDQHGSPSCPVRLEMKLYLDNIKLKEEQLRAARQVDSEAVYQTVCYVRDLERFDFFSYVSDDMSDPISDIDSFQPSLHCPLSVKPDPVEQPSPPEDPLRLPGRRSKQKNKEHENFVSWYDSPGKGDSVGIDKEVPVVSTPPRFGSPRRRGQSPRSSGSSTPSSKVSSPPSPPSSMFQCPTCGAKVLKKKELVLQHIKTHNLSVTDLKQSFLAGAPSSTDRLSEWITELIVETKLEQISPNSRGVYTCCDCAKYFRSKELMRNHLFSCKDGSGEKTKPSPQSFKLLFSTFGNYHTSTEGT